MSSGVLISEDLLGIILAKKTAQKFSVRVILPFRL